LNLAGLLRLGRPLRRRRGGFHGLRFGGAATLEKLLDLLDLFLGQTRKRGPLAWDAGLRANIDQFLAVNFQLFR